MSNETKISEKLYFRYEHLADKYAKKIFSYEEISFEYEDLVQEFKIKIFTSIKSYGRRWAKYRRNEATKPVPLRYYLAAACSNKSRDFIKYISRENHKLRIDEVNYDYGTEDDTDISPEGNKFIVNGINLLEGLSGKERSIFSLFLRGYKTKILNKVYFNKEEEKIRKQVIKDGDTPYTVKDVIESQKNYLIKKYGSDLLKQREIYSSYNLNEE